MRERLSRLSHTLRTTRRIPILGSVSDYVRTLSPGDALIALILGALVMGSSLAGIYAFERTLLVEVPAKGGSLTEGVLGSPRFVNPLLALSDADKDLSLLTHAGLMGVGNEGELVPVLADSYEISEDGLTYTFTLKENLSFHDGSPLTAEDVVFTVEKAQDPGLKSPELANWANILVEAVDARTIRFTLPKPYAPFLEDATLGIIPARLYKELSNEEFPFSRYMQEPIGAGPFKVTHVERSRNGMIERYELSAFKDFAVHRPYLDTIRFEFFAQESDLIRAYDRGRVESAHGIPNDDALRVPYARVFGVFWNANQNPLFARSEVREALSRIINREEMIAVTLGGHATAITGPVPPGSGVETLATDSPHEEELAQAREVLEDAGWSYDAETHQWNHEDAGVLTVTVKTSNVPELKAVAQAVQEDWQTFGVATTLEFYEPGDLTSTVIRPRRYEALLFGMVVGRDHDLFAFWESSQRNDPGLNVSMYANRSVDTLLQSIRENTDRESARAELTELNELIASEYPAAFLYAPDFLYALPERMQGVSITQIASPSDRFAGVWNWYRHSQFVWPVFAP